MAKGNLSGETGTHSKSFKRFISALQTQFGNSSGSLIWSFQDRNL